MSEKAPRKISQELHKASMEGNVRMPQVALGITVFTAERCLASEDLKEAVGNLAAPIPLDEPLIQRTNKANAQHEHHGIGIKLTPEQVRDIQAKGNLATIGLIGNVLGATVGQRMDISFNEVGEWADADIQERVATTQELLTEENINILRPLLKEVETFLKEAEMAAKLTDRKSMYEDWESKTNIQRSYQRQAIKKETGMVLDGILERLNDLYEDGSRTLPEKRIIAALQHRLKETVD